MVMAMSKSKSGKAKPKEKQVIFVAQPKTIDPLIDFLVDMVVAQKPMLSKKHVREIVDIIASNNIVSHTQTVRRLAVDLADAFFKSSRKNKRPATVADVTLAFNEALSSILLSFLGLSADVKNDKIVTEEEPSDESSGKGPVKDDGPELYR